MGRIRKTLDHLRRGKRKALVLFVTAGDPDLNFTEALVPALAESGADLIEIGVPFSDPVGDGVVIQASSQRALKQGVTTADVLGMVRRLRAKVRTPIILMGYYNPVLRFGLERFARECSRSGVDGLIMIDVPPEEAGPLHRVLRPFHLDLIFLLTPASPEERIRLVVKKASGFIYFVSYTGVTGDQTAAAGDVARSVRRIRRRTRLPILIGFGIRNAAQARRMADVSDGVAIGSALIREIEQGRGSRTKIDRARRFVSSIRKALDS